MRVLMRPELVYSAPFFKVAKLIDQVQRLREITQRLMRITRYETRNYLTGTIIDIEKASQLHSPDCKN